MALREACCFAFLSQRANSSRHNALVGQPSPSNRAEYAERFGDDQVVVFNGYGQRDVLEPPGSLVPELVFTCGAPGSGKTTWARCHFVANGVNQNVFCNDDGLYIWDDALGRKTYQWTVANYKEAVKACQHNVKSLLRQGRTVVVNNTNLVLSSMRSYVAMLQELYGSIEAAPHRIKFVVMKEYDIDICHSRCTHLHSGLRKYKHEVDASANATSLEDFCEMAAAMLQEPPSVAKILGDRVSESICPSPMRSSSLHLWFVRHGESENNVSYRRLSKPDYVRTRSADPPLSSFGMQQADEISKHEALAAIFRADKPINIYSSPMRRSIQTAAGIQRHACGKVPIRLKPDLAEVGGLNRTVEDGSIEDLPGLGFAEFLTSYADLSLDVTDISADGWWAGKPSESGKETATNIELNHSEVDRSSTAINERVERVADWLLHLQPSGNDVSDVVLVGHGNFMEKVLLALLGITGTRCRIVHGNTAVTHLELKGESVIVHCMNVSPGANVRSDFTV